MRVWRLLSLVCATWFATLPAGAEVDSDTFGGLRARSIGPAVMSGRIAALDAVPGPPLTIYVGAASGGVWKSTDGAITFRPVFDEHPQAIGAVKVDPSNPDVVWVGTGESWVRNSVSVGRGVFKSTDGGETWQDLGLHETERISTIRVNPTNGETVYVCATGHLWNANEERGLYKTTDGGAAWEKVLYLDEDTGCADLDLDPRNPRILYAALWQFRRSPDYFRSGGPGSGLYKSSDAGATWRKLEQGLPEGELGRIAVAVAPSNPSVVYASVEAQRTAIYRSDDAGETWRRTGTSMNVAARPFYLSELVIDPVDENRVYKPGFSVGISSDGGRSFAPPAAPLHSDHHALWVHPDNPHEVLVGTDGGLYVSHDRGGRWRHVKSLPISQFYHVSVDREWPYNVYGGLQDNFSWAGPSRAPFGIRTRDWHPVGTGDGFWVFADPEDANIIYNEYQGGQLFRLDRARGELQSIRPFPEPGQPALRFNWNAPLHLSPTRPGTLYLGSQFVHRSPDRGQSWETISPDLTTNDPAKQRQQSSGGLTTDNTTAENHCTIYAISESPKDSRVVWAGTDDGRLHMTRDGGNSWTSVVENVPGLPAGTWVSSVRAGMHRASEAFVTFDGHRTGDMAVYVYRTDDFGATWTSLVTEDVEGYAWVVEQDPVNSDLLYLGTEFGLFLSLDGGNRWARFKENLPKVAVHDIAIHPTEHDVILGTHGRGIYILDDVTPLRALSAEVLASEVALLPSRPVKTMADTFLWEFGSDEEFTGETIPEAVPIHYYLDKRHLFGDLELEVYDAEGELVTSLPASPRRGLNRVWWPMRLASPKIAAGTSLVALYEMDGVILGPRVPEGTYTVRLVKGDKTLEGTVVIAGDPTSPHSVEDRMAQYRTALELYRAQEDLSRLTGRLAELRDRSMMDAAEARPQEAQRLQATAARLEEMRAALVSTDPAGIFSGDQKLRENLGVLYAQIVRYGGHPTSSQLLRARHLMAELEAAELRLDSFLAESSLTSGL